MTPMPEPPPRTSLLIFRGQLTGWPLWCTECGCVVPPIVDAMMAHGRLHGALPGQWQVDP